MLLNPCLSYRPSVTSKAEFGHAAARVATVTGIFSMTCRNVYIGIDVDFRALII